MSESICALGCDPGGTTGFFLANWRPGFRKHPFTRAWQCDMDGAAELAGWILRGYRSVIGAVGIESFDSRLSGKGLAGFDPKTQHELIRALIEVTGAAGVKVATYQPGTVKPWIGPKDDKDRRLRESGLLEATSGMPKHSRDAARVALYTAVRHLGLPDPLSRRGASDAARPG